MKKFFFLFVFFLFGAGCTPVIQDSIRVEEIDPDFSRQAQVDTEQESLLDRSDYITVNLADIDGLVGPFDFVVEIPSTWLVEAVPQIEGVNIYDPNIGAVSTLEKSQIFLRYFWANDFLTLNTVDIFDRKRGEVNGRQIVTYDIAKKKGVANFFFQPSWRNERHLVTDIMVSERRPSLFFVFGRSPSLPEEVFQRFLESARFPGDEQVGLIYPIDQFVERITKKPFGIKIDPATSPVQPERFSGYHTGVDIEYGEVESEVEVRSMADGTVVRSGTVSGYGGMVAIQHEIAGVMYITIYGHLDPDSLVSRGIFIKKGQRVGVLGDGFTNETDGERKHLHFALQKGNEVNVAGYVGVQRDLEQWVDPVVFLRNIVSM